MFVYRVKRPFKSVGIYYPIGHEISEDDFWDQNKLRLGKIKVSEGFLVRVEVETPKMEAPLPIEIETLEPMDITAKVVLRASNATPVVGATPKIIIK